MMAMPSSRNRSFAKQNIHLRKALFRSRTAHRGRALKVLKTRFTPPFLTDFVFKGVPLTIPLKNANSYMARKAIDKNQWLLNYQP